MKKLLTVFLAVIGFSTVVVGCGTGPAKSNAAVESPGSIQSASGKVETISSRSSQATKIRLIFEGGEAVAELYDNPTSRDLVSMLPLTLSFKDFHGTEKIAYPPRNLSTEKAPDGFDPAEGDLTLYAPWGNLALFYRDFGYAQGLVPIGHLTAGLEKLAKVNGDFTVRIEAVKE